MKREHYPQYWEFLLKEVVDVFYQKRLNKLKELNLNHILKKKNPYLFKAKNIEHPWQLVQSSLDAFLSSQEETIFGNLLEAFAIHIAKTMYGGFKSKLKSVDLEFERENTYFIVGIKSGTNWGNADQINKMRDNFKAARDTLRKSGITKEIVAVNGCMYGKEAIPLRDKKHIRVKGQPTKILDEEPERVYYKYCGQVFWDFITEDTDFYKEMIVPIDEEAKKKGKAFQELYDQKLNIMTKDFTDKFQTDGKIDWLRLIEFVSKQAVPRAV
jgi:hypothetical protein